MANARQPHVFSEFLMNKCLINGTWVEAQGGMTFDVTNPATGETVGSVPMMGKAETREAIEAAHAAQGPWSRRTAKERSDILRLWFDLIMQNADVLAEILTFEQGKPLREARAEIAYAASFVEFYSAEATRIYGESIPAHRADSRILVLKQPIGVVGCITPWNFPSAMITRKAAPALAAGCTVVLKPAEQTPLSALALASLSERAGLPRGVLNIITGNPVAIGAELCSNPVVRKLSFTGSTEVGRLLAAQCATTTKKMTLELGGNAPFIVFDDADLDSAVDGAVLAKYRHSGQTCVCTNRFLIQNPVYDAFVERFLHRVRKLRVGNGLDSTIDIGPLIDGHALEKVESHVQDALEKKAILLAGGKRHAEGRTFFEPTVIGEMTSGMLIAKEETFGPVAALFRFDTEEEAISLANDTPFGLAGYFYTRDLARAFRVAEALECGMVGINTGFLSVETAPFGGIKQSGIGREGSHHGIDEFVELKYICIGGIAQIERVF
jgi:succinate-semialdehyde dehydrogenase/glutarate-semialdehyde dehydrogenase